MKVVETKLPGVLVIEPRVFGDPRGFFVETYNAERYHEAGLTMQFVQDNVSLSSRGVLRGLHMQSPRPQGKLIMAITGEIFDVAVDLRVGSPTFGQWESCILSGETKRQFWIPPGLAHGFCVLSEEALVLYKCTDTYQPNDERTIAWNDPDLGVDWPIATPSLSKRDAQAPRFADFPRERLISFTRP